MTWAPPKVSLSDRINQQQNKIIESEFRGDGGTKFGKDTKNGQEGGERRSKSGREERSKSGRVCVMVEDTCSDVKKESPRA
jgi:hypothetical protein